MSAYSFEVSLLLHRASQVPTDTGYFSSVALRFSWCALKVFFFGFLTRAVTLIPSQRLRPCSGARTQVDADTHTHARTYARMHVRLHATVHAEIAAWHQQLCGCRCVRACVRACMRACVRLFEKRALQTLILFAGECWQWMEAKRSPCHLTLD